MNIIIFENIKYIIENLNIEYLVDWVLPWWVFGLCFSLIKGKNPVMSLMYLIALFLTGIVLMLYSQVKFMAFIYMVVYIGAIAILFLFVLMLLNIVGIIKKEKVDETTDKWKWYIWEGVLLFMIAELIVTKIIDEAIIIFTGNSEFLEKTSPTYYTIICSITKDLDPIGWGDVNTISVPLYEESALIFILGGVLLLVAMIGAIVITLSTTEPVKKKEQKKRYWNFIKENIK